MNLIDKVILEWSYRTKKGYPDINNKEDMRLFESMFGIDLREEITTKNNIKAAEYIANSALGQQNNVKSFKSGKYRNRINITTIKDEDGIKNFVANVFNIKPDDIVVIPGGGPGNERNSVPALRFTTKQFGEVQVNVSTGKKGTGGKDNEAKLFNTINSIAAGDFINVLFKGNNSVNYTVENVTSARDASTETKEGTKADVQLFSNENLVGNISVKEYQKGFRWASIGGKVADFRKNFVNKALTDDKYPIGLLPNPESHRDDRYLMIDKKTEKRVTKVVVDNFPEIEDEKFIFGTDNPKTVVAIQDFNDSHFDFDNETNTLTIETEFVFTKKSQIDGSKYEPFFVIMQHINQPYGLDFRILPAYKANLTSAGREIDYKQVD